MHQLKVDGKFFRAGGERVFLKMVTYGPFPIPRPAAVADDREQMAGIARAGFNAVRIYEEPDDGLLDAAQDAGLWVFVGLNWEYMRDFISKPSLYGSAQVALADGLKSWGRHPAVAGVLVANEIPSDMVRWMGVMKVRRALEELIALGRLECPGLLYGYANFPTTEYLEPANADFTAMNVYLEKKEDFAGYLPRLHNVAGDRPVLLSEFGLDTRRNGEAAQRDAMLWGVRESLSAGMAGLTVYAWSDHWLNRGVVMDDWCFGLTDREGREKPALMALAGLLPGVTNPEHGIELTEYPVISVVVCTHNGAHRMEACLSALLALDYPDYEVVVVDDGSTDPTAEVVGKFDGVRLIQLRHAGLSAARNRGAEVARGEIIAFTDDDCEPDAAWLKWLAYAFAKGGWDACGGPNLPPRPIPENNGRAGVSPMDEAVVAAAPGAPSHVLLEDGEAEHLPGCNLVVRKDVMLSLGGFGVAYRVAGDDVDFCWRLREAGFRLGFCGAAFVWHRRRTSLWRYIKQQYGYGKAEALLMRDHPERFRRGSGALWQGQVYCGGAMTVDAGSVIYHGSMGMAPYQQLALTMQPQRPMPEEFVCMESKIKLFLAMAIQPRVRAWSRWWHSLRWRGAVERVPKKRGYVLVDCMRDYDEYEARWWAEGGIAREEVLEAILEDGWLALENDSDWDCDRFGLRLVIACEPHESGSLVLTRMEMDSRNKGRLPADFVRRLEGLGLVRV